MGKDKRAQLVADRHRKSVNMAMQSGREIPTQAERYGDGIGSGNSRDHDQEQGMKENEVARQRSPFGAMVEDFSPVWCATKRFSRSQQLMVSGLRYV